jgi:hypothetical protein
MSEMRKAREFWLCRVPGKDLIHTFDPINICTNAHIHVRELEEFLELKELAIACERCPLWILNPEIVKDYGFSDHAHKIELDAKECKGKSKRKSKRKSK